MKKILSVILGLVAMTSLYAANTEVARLTLTGQGGVENSYITLRVDPAVTTAQTGAFFQNTDLDGNVNLYINYGSEKYSSIKKDDLTNLPLEVITNRRAAANQHYTISFNVPTSTVGLKLKDLKTGDNVDIVNNGTYEFDVNTTLHSDYVEGANYVVKDRFVINYTPIAIMGTDTWFGQGYDVNLTVSADLLTATGTIDFSGKAGEWYNFKAVLGSEWLSNAQGFTRANNSKVVNTTETDNMYFEIEDGTVDYVYTFTWTFATNTLTIGYPDQVPVYAAEVTTNADGLATFSHASALAPVETGVKLYKGAVSGETLALTQVDYVKAGEGVIVYGAANTTYHFNAGTGTSVFDGNELKAASTWAYPHAGYNAYVLSGSSLYLYEGENMKPNKAFLLLSAGSGAPRRISLRFDQATAIDNVAAENVKAEKVVENGQIFIRRGNEVYNLQGQLVK